ncbi:TolC family outer membrane protein [Novosphingobium olei]|uniref:TolC family outer membrane protein n=1 Tax=Novosphingobium olei TaxID=2728851 RepID=A0A7Y0BQB3_9SPHN|nr:TolC family outer membrane protein [Novosphingobium olei]NML94577.1 TolC family outer membrane protein [Novosphingobium olei]
MRILTLRASLLVGAIAACTAPARADDLRGALVAAYQTNPDLQAARASQRATDEGVPIARASALPSLSGSASYTENLEKSTTPQFQPNRTVSAGANLSLPIYAGGSIKNSIRAAKTRVEAGQADLRGVESGVFSQVVSAYMDVIRDQAIVGLNRSNVQVLEVNLKATSDRYEIGDVTRTDVAQSNSRLALARGDLRTAEANLVGSRERYVQVVGQAPKDLAPPPPLAGLPDTPEDAVETALANNPDLAAARLDSKAAAYDVKVAGSARLPRISVFTGTSYNDYLNSVPINDTVPGTVGTHFGSSQAGVQATIPLFQGGLPAARERQAQASEGATLEREIAIERQVIATVRSAYTSWKASLDIIAMNQTAVDAAALSLEGVRAENTVGNRTILNILDAEQELLRAQVQLVAARRNAYVAGFNLLAAMGKAQAKDLSLDAGPESAALYDPQVNYDRVKGKIWDWARDPAPKPQSTRTVDSPAQDATIPAQPAP